MLTTNWGLKLRIVDDFRADLRTGRSIVLVGTGVSLAATGNAKSTWGGLLKSGIEYAQQQMVMDAETADLCNTLLTESPSASDFLDVATEVTQALDGPDGPRFADWLNRDVGYLQATDTRLLDAILKLNLPILTTNYDGLLERAGNRDHVTWIQPGQLQQVLAGNSNAIGHFHGYYTDPRSIVLSRGSYELLLRDQNIEALRNAMSAVNTLVYIGFGAGLDDPNFISLRRWIQEALPTQTLRHYRLCLEREQAGLTEIHKNEPIYAVPYGREHEDLAEFLEGLDTSGTLVQQFTPSQVLNNIDGQVRSASVIGMHVPNDDRSHFHELLIPPVIIPIQHDEFVSALQNKDPLERPKRCDPNEELQHSKMLIVADENSGLSSALLWFIAQHHLRDSNLIPLLINYRNLGRSKKPLDLEIRKQLRQVGYSIGDNADLPSVIIAIDNVHVSDDKLLRRVIAELADAPFRQLIIGCRSGTEIELQPLLYEAGIEMVVRHIGRLNRNDVRRLTALVDGPRSKELASKAIEVARTQHLPTTPFTFSMITSALLRGESLLSATSQTALLDAYVTLLMGWGRYDDDSRFGMDAFNRSFIIEQLAELYVTRRRGSLPQEEVVAQLANRFKKLEWPDSPIDTLKDLETRRLMVIRGTEVAFAQSSYLHLFAAKRATRSTEFLQKLRESPLFFAPILQHYAALVRNDVKLLNEMSDLLNTFADEETFETGIFSIPSNSKETLSVSKALSNFERDVESVTAVDEEDSELLPLDERPDRDIEPFPLSPIEEERSITRMIATLRLVSTILRDTEIIEDLGLRRNILTQLLSAWSNLVYALELDEEFNEFTNETVAEIEQQLPMPERRVAEFRRDFHEGMAISLAVGGLCANLSSRKLSVSLDTCLNDPEFNRHVGRAFMGAVLAFDIQEPGWSEHLSMIGSKFGDTRAVDQILRRIVQQAIVLQNNNAKDEENLLDFLVQRAVSDIGADGKGQTSRIKAELKRQLTAARMARRAKRLPAGRSVLSATELDEIES